MLLLTTNVELKMHTKYLGDFPHIVKIALLTLTSQDWHMHLFPLVNIVSIDWCDRQGWSVSEFWHFQKSRNYFQMFWKSVVLTLVLSVTQKNKWGKNVVKSVLIVLNGSRCGSTTFAVLSLWIPRVYVRKL